MVLSENGLYQTIWNMMERYFGLEITKPLLFILPLKIYYSFFAAKIPNGKGLTGGRGVNHSISIIGRFISMDTI